MKNVNDGFTWDCEVCSKPCSTPGNLRSHLKNNHKEQQYISTTQFKEDTHATSLVVQETVRPKDTNRTDIKKKKCKSDICCKAK